MIKKQLSLDPKSVDFDVERINYEYFNGCCYTLSEIEYLNKLKDKKEDKTDSVKPIWNVIVK